MSIPFNSAPGASCPFNLYPQCKKSSLCHHFRGNSWKLGSQKLVPQAHVLCGSKIIFFQSLVPGACLIKIVRNSATSNTQKTPKNWQKMHCIYSFCPIELTKSWYTWSLTPVIVVLEDHNHNIYLRTLVNDKINHTASIRHVKICSKYTCIAGPM